MTDQTSNSKELQAVPTDFQELDDLFSETEQENIVENRTFLAFFPSEKSGFHEDDSKDNYYLFSLLIQMEADVVIIPSNTNEKLKSLLMNFGLAELSDKSDISQKPYSDLLEIAKPFKLEFLSYSFFSTKQALSTFEQVVILGIPQEASKEAKMAQLGLLDQNLPSSILAALAGLFSYIQKAGVVYTYKGLLNINSINIVSLNDMLKIDYSSLMAFQILKSEIHPKMMGDGHSKEGLSVFNIMDRTSSFQGRQLLKTWLLQPCKNLNIIQFRQRVVSWLVNNCNMELLREISNHLRGIRNVPKITSRISNYAASIVDWSNLRTSTRSIIWLFDFVRNTHLAKESVILEVEFSNMDIGKLLNFQQVLSIFYNDAVFDDLRNILSWIERVLNFKESKLQGRIYVNDGYCEDLDNARCFYYSLEEHLTEVGSNEIERLDALGVHIPWIKVTYIPRLGYLLATGKEDNESRGDTIGSLDLTVQSYAKDLELAFSTSDTVYYKTSTMRELDEKLGDIFDTILELENECLHVLEQQVIPLLPMLYKCSKQTAQFDCFISMALTAIQYQWCEPSVTKNRGYVIKSGRHPLYELNSKVEFVANDTAATMNSLYIVTGPNYSGKSVYLKQIALIVYLAHIGSFVPAKEAQIALTDQIQTRIQTEDSISLHLSSFFLDCTQVAMMLRTSTNQSLLVIDEFGKGTMASNGMALLSATLLTLLEMKDKMPTVFCATHMYDILTNGIISKSNEQVSIMSMECIFERDTHLERELIPLYRVVPGLLSTESYAVHCAAKSGIPMYVLQRAIEVQTCLQKNETLELRNEKYQKKVSTVHRIVQEFLETDFTSASLTEEDWFPTWDL
ncbi:DNA mismatch repair protein MutS [Galdieria sulphuraria]|uniref:DNA mismatch repair protein MutS n=1 Tax=Galdieria sulphuraria TaxID=130081 RepID=M2XAS8_GALSU|nr:DNA mismatch repair protein MutS [Galdieria sulphuraria]EME26992.1 DNA mismatch repair protein MutS [Galdieria sulphuraria]|eukprot:XP_005703512.1 DNA mismatch repair protein MutS [Galdieria sulphuraria]